jgi:hypothetical protein
MRDEKLCALKDPRASAAEKAAAVRALGRLLGDATYEGKFAMARDIPALVELLRCGSDEGRVAAAQTLTHFASDGPNKEKVVLAVVLCGAIPPLLTLVDEDWGRVPAVRLLRWTRRAGAVPSTTPW